MKLKTRTNQPVYYKLPVSSNIQSMSDDLLNSLRVGDVVQKKTGNQKHCYVVTYKEEKHGICLSYVACGYMETISYDYTGGHWVFNSKDVCEVPSEAHIKELIEADKDILSQIEVIVDEVNQTTTYVFPTGVLPLKYYSGLNDYYLYFNYGSNCIFNEEDLIADSSRELSMYEGKIALILDSVGDISEIQELMYIHATLQDTSSLGDWFDILNSKPLYQHNITFDSDIETGIEIQVVSYYNEPYNISNLKNAVENGYIINVSGNFEYDQHRMYAMFLISVGNTVKVCCFDSDTGTFGNVTIDAFIDDNLSRL